MNRMRLFAAILVGSIIVLAVKSPVLRACDGAASSGSSAPEQVSGGNGVPAISWEAGLSSIWTAGPHVEATVNGLGGRGSVFIGTGGSLVDVTDFNLPFNGVNWRHRRMHTSLNTSALDWQGEKWWGNEMMHITVAGADGSSDVTWKVDPNYSFTWTYDSETFQYSGPGGFPLTMSFVSGSDEYRFETDDGWMYVFHDGAHTNAGKLKRIDNPFDNDLAFTYSSGKLTDIVADVVTGSDHKITYTYFTAGDNNGRLQYIKVYKTTTTTDANLIAKVEHVYHDSASDDYGTTGDLMKVIVSRKATTDGDGTLSIEETYRYRYYKGAYDASTNPGTDNLIKYVLYPENGQRLNDEVGTPESQTNANWTNYANIAYEYDSNYRVRKTEERLPGSGCGCGGGGGAGTTNYTWTVNGGSPGVDTWKLHGVADREDGHRVIFDVDPFYNLLTWVLQEKDGQGATLTELIHHFDYGTGSANNNRLIAIYNPSACSDYDESAAPYAVTLRSSAGLVQTIEYFTDPNYYGYPKKIRVKQGSSGTADTLTEYGRTITQRPDLVTSIIRYESGSEANGRTTSFTHTFYDGDKRQLKQLDTTHPSVSAAKNGPDASAVTRKFYDKLTGALRWTLDGEGFAQFYAYDDETGVQDLHVADANTSTLMSAIDDNWDGVAHGGLATDDTVPFSRAGEGTALDIDSSSVIDWLGRTRTTTDGGGMITYFVYMDDQQRTYSAWNTSTSTVLLSIQIEKTDKDGGVKEEITLKNSVTPSVTSNEPTGTESYSNSDMVSRTVHTYGSSGAVASTKRYHNMAASGDGTRYTDYYQTNFEYDSMGRVEYTITDVSDESTYDREQVRRTYYDFIGRVTKTAEGVSDNTHDITGGKPTLSTTIEYFFDDPDTDSTPENGVGDGHLSWIRRWWGTSGGEYEDTNFRYDYRNRQQLIIPPLAPYTLIKHDNLDRVTAVGTYSATTNLDPGDDPATTEYANRLDLSKTYYDEWGRVYKAEKYDDPADSTPEDELASLTYYDRRGLVWASDSANTGITFTQYDGAGRKKAVLLGAQFDSAKYTNNAPDYPDADEWLCQVTEYTMDEDGNVQKMIAKELNHNDTDGMDLANNDDYIRTYVYNYYDAAHRLTDTANFGTNNADGWKDNSSAQIYDNDGGTAGDQPPTRSDTILVTSYAYDSEGRQSTVTDPKAIVTRSVYDKVGRVTQKEENDGGGALERITSYTYNGQDSLTKITADLSADQVTEYVYGDVKNSRWVTKIKYPATDTDNSKTPGQPSDETYDRIVFTYNVDGTLATRTDQNGTVLTWSYDDLRRKTEEEVTTVGSYTGGSGAVDGTIRSFTWTYDSEGRVQRTTSHTDTTPDTGSWTDAANQIKYTYNAADQLTKEEQEEDGAVDGSTLAVEYTYGTDYGSAYYNRRNYITYPDGRKIWFGYTHSGGANTLQDTINDKFNRVGQIAKDNSSAIGSLYAEYDFNGIGRQVRRVHDEDSGKYGNDTKMDLWHGVSGDYDGLDRFGRIVDLKHTDFNGGAADFFRLKYAYDRNGNRTDIEDVQYANLAQSFTYDNLNRLTNAERGMYDTGGADVASSDAYENFNMDLLGNFTAGAGGIKVNAATSSLTHAVNETNEITTLDRPNISGPRAIISEPFTSLDSDLWTQTKGTWSISSGKVNVDTLTSGEALLRADGEWAAANVSFSVNFPGGSGGSDKAGLVFADDGNNNSYAVVLRWDKYLEIYNVSSGSWGSPVASTEWLGLTTGTDIAINVVVKGRTILVRIHDFLAYPGYQAELSYTAGASIPLGRIGLYSTKTGMQFASIGVADANARDPKKLRRMEGLANAAQTSSKLELNPSASGYAGIVEVDSFSDDDYMVQANIDFNSQDTADIWVRYQNVDNGYKLVYSSSAAEIYLYKYVNGTETYFTGGSFTCPCSFDTRIKLSGTSIKVWLDSTLVIDTTDSAHAGGTVAFDGETVRFDSLKIGYDNNSDNDIDDGGDDLAVDEDFGGTSCSPAHDHAGNLVDDCVFRYTYDAWNRLVKVQSSKDSGAVTYQTSEFYADGRRANKVVTKSGSQDGTTRYYHDGQKIVETRNGSNVMVQQFIHGTQYIDELVLVRVKDKGEMFVHQDANWNVIGTTDMGRRVLEHNVLSPYGQLAVNQETGFGDRDGDSDVDSTDKGTVGVTCTGTVSGSCRILDLDFDGDYDSSDATLCDALPQGWQGREGLIASAVGQPFAHQGLLFEPEIGSYQNRARQFSSTLSQYLSRDPLSSAPLAGSGYGDGLSLYLPLRGNPCARLDSSGEASVTNLPWQILVRSRIVFWGPAADNPPGQWRTVLSGMRNILNQLRVPRRGRLAVIDPETGTPKPMVFTLSGDYWDDASGTCNNLPNHDDFEGSYPVGSTLGSCAGNAENYMQGDAAMGLHPFPYVSGTGRVILGRAQFCFGEDHAWAIPEGDVAAHEFGHNLCARHCNGPGHGSDSGPHLMRSSGGWFMPCHTLSEIAPGHMIPWTTECVNLGSLGLPPMSQVQH